MDTQNAHLLAHFRAGESITAIEALSRATKGIDWQKYEQVTAAGKRPDETHLEFALRCMSEAQK